MEATGSKGEGIRIAPVIGKHRNEVVLAVFKEGKVPDVIWLSIREAVVLFESLADSILTAHQCAKDKL